MAPYGPVRCSSFNFRTSDHYPQDLTGTVTISYSPGSNYPWKIGAGATTDIYKGVQQPQGVNTFLMALGIS
jgi:hypothetical protein